MLFFGRFQCLLLSETDVVKDQRGGRSIDLPREWEQLKRGQL